MSLSKTWYTSANRAMDDVTTGLKSNASILFALKGFLTGALTGTGGTGGQPPSSAFWTVDSSSNSSVAGSGDKMSASFLSTDWVRAAAASPHSWYVLKSPVSAGILDGPWYLMISWGTASDTNIIIGISKVQPTGGTTSADPTASGQSTYVSAAFLFSQASNGKCHIVMDAKGSFHFLQSFNGSGRFSTYISVNELVETRSSGDSARAVLVADALNTGVGCPRLASGAVLGTGVRGLANDGTTAMTSSTGKLGSFCWNGTSTDDTIRTVLNAIDSKTDGILMGWIYDGTAGHQATRGRIPDVWSIGTMDAPGSGSPAAATPDRVVAGNTLIPFSVTPGL